MKRALVAILLFLTAVFIGCGSQAPQSVRMKLDHQQSNSPRQVTTTAGEAEKTEFTSFQVPAPAKENGNPVAPIGADLPPERKIVFTGTLIVEVKDFGEARKRLDELIRTAKAYYSKSEIEGDSGKKRSGTFVVKVPVENFQSLVNDLTELGNPLKNHTDSQDVTEEFVDTTARVKNLKAEEEVLNRLLKDAGSRLEDVFKIREQIRNNRLEIERNEARVLALGKMATLSTLTVTLREIETYIAPVIPKPTEPTIPDFSERAGKTWSESFGSLKAVSQLIALFAVAISPWLPALAVFGIGIWLVRRYTFKRPITA